MKLKSSKKKSANTFKNTTFKVLYIRKCRLCQNLKLNKIKILREDVCEHKLSSTNPLLHVQTYAVIKDCNYSWPFH